MKYLRSALACILALGTLSGCRPTPGTVQQNVAPLPPGVKEISLVVARNRMVDGESKTEGVQTFPSPGAAEIEKQIKAVDWQDTNLRVSVGLGKVDGAGHHSMSVRRVDATPGMHGVTVLWQAVEGAASVGRRTDVDSIDEAVAMMLAFYRGDADLATKAHWETVRE